MVYPGIFLEQIAISMRAYTWQYAYGHIQVSHFFGSLTFFDWNFFGLLRSIIILSRSFTWFSLKVLREVLIIILFFRFLNIISIKWYHLSVREMTYVFPFQVSKFQRISHLLAVFIHLHYLLFHNHRTLPSTSLQNVRWTCNDNQNMIKFH